MHYLAKLGLFFMLIFSTSTYAKDLTIVTEDVDVSCSRIQKVYSRIQAQNIDINLEECSLDGGWDDIAYLSVSVEDFSDKNCRRDVQRIVRISGAPISNSDLAEVLEGTGIEILGANLDFKILGVPYCE